MTDAEATDRLAHHTARLVGGVAFIGYVAGYMAATHATPSVLVEVGGAFLCYLTGRGLFAYAWKRAKDAP